MSYWEHIHCLFALPLHTIKYILLDGYAAYRKAIAKLMNNDLKYCYYGNKKKTIIKAIAIYEVSSFFSLESFKLKESKPFFFFQK